MIKFDKKDVEKLYEMLYVVLSKEGIKNEFDMKKGYSEEDDCDICDDLEFEFYDNKEVVKVLENYISCIKDGDIVIDSYMDERDIKESKISNIYFDFYQQFDDILLDKRLKELN